MSEDNPRIAIETIEGYQFKFSITPQMIDVEPCDSADYLPPRFAGWSHCRFVDTGDIEAAIQKSRDYIAKRVKSFLADPEHKARNNG